MSDEPLILRPGEYARGRVTPYQENRKVMLDDESNVIRDGDALVPPPRSWQSALHQLAGTLAPGADVEIDPMDPEVSCARIAEAIVQHQDSEVGRRVESAMGEVSNIWYCEKCDRWQDERSPCEADARFDEREKIRRELESWLIGPLDPADAGLVGGRRIVDEINRICKSNPGRDSE